MAPCIESESVLHKERGGNIFHAFDGRAITPFSQDAVSTASRGTTRANFGDVEQGSLDPTAIITSPEAGPEKDAIRSHEAPFPYWSTTISTHTHTYASTGIGHLCAAFGVLTSR
jgi:hypothetical protein